MSLYSIVFKDIGSVKDFLTQIPHWVYVTYNGGSHYPPDINNEEIYKRAYKNQYGNLEFLRKKDEENDLISGLFPRIEFIPRILLPKEALLHIRYEVSIMEDELFNGSVFQIIDHNILGGMKPLLQIEFKNKIFLKFNDICNGHSIKINYEELCFGYYQKNEWYNFDIYILLSTKKNGCIHVYLNERCQFKKDNIETCFESKDFPQIQYGIFAQKGEQLRIQVRKLIYETVYAIPKLEPKSEIPISEEKYRDLYPIDLEMDSFIKIGANTEHDIEHKAKIELEAELETKLEAEAEAEFISDNEVQDAKKNNEMYVKDLHPIIMNKVKIDSKSDLFYDNICIMNQISGFELKNCKNLTFENCIIKNCAGNAFSITNCDNIIIKNCYFENIRTGVLVNNSSNIHISYCYCKNIQGMIPRGQFIQFDKVSGSNNYIGYNTIINESENSSSEDIINIYKSNGNINNPIIIEHNYIKGGGPSLSSGGIMLGDNGGNHQIARNNILINPGQYGIAVVGGENIYVSENKIFGKQFPFSNVGIYVWKQKAPIATNIFILQNKVGFINKSGKSSSWWNGKNTINLTVQNNEWDLPYQEPEITNDRMIMFVNSINVLNL